MRPSLVELDPQDQQLIEQYLEDQKNTWSEVTLAKELPRLKRVVPDVGLPPTDVWHNLSSLKPHSKVKYWTRLIAFYDWLISVGVTMGPNPYREWRGNNKKLFRGVYEPSLPDITFEEAEDRIKNGISNQAIRQKALELLYTGLRISECLDKPRAGKGGAKGQLVTIQGKGGKRRPIFGKTPPRKSKNFKKVVPTTLRRSLKKIGLTPHMLRKIFASKLAQQGLPEIDLCRVMGWSSFQPAKLYLTATRDDKLALTVKRMINE